jgi:23S rRNA A2030 N6-methylase RlmJ
MERTEKIAMLDLLAEMSRDITEWKKELSRFLKECDIEADFLSLKELIDSVKYLKVRKNTEEYAGVVKDSNGYVIRLYRMDDFLPLKSLPNDASHGYYKIEGDKLVLDEERQRQIEEV